MQHMRWSWQDLQAAPSRHVARIGELLAHAAQAKAQTPGAEAVQEW